MPDPTLPPPRTQAVQPPSHWWRGRLVKPAFPRAAQNWAFYLRHAEPELYYHQIEIVSSVLACPRTTSDTVLILSEALAELAGETSFRSNAAALQKLSHFLIDQAPRYAGRAP